MGAICRPLRLAVSAGTVRGLGSTPPPLGATPFMPIAKALDAWRAAEREWTVVDAADPGGAREAARRVIETWLAYQDLAGTFDGDAVLVADRSGMFVAANDGAGVLLGRPVSDIVGRTVADITAPGSAGLREGMWQAFLDTGTMRGTYCVLGPTDEVLVTYDARAHHPLPGYFSSRLRPLDR